MASDFCVTSAAGADHYHSYTSIVTVSPLSCLANAATTFANIDFHFLKFPGGHIYSVVVLMMSESPGSVTVRTDTRWSLPQAVPSSTLLPV